MSSKVQKGDWHGKWLVLADPAKSHARCVCMVCQKTRKDIRTSDLLSGKTTMCRSCSTKNEKREHGLTESSEYSSWGHMIRRCHNTAAKDYHRYGGKGIHVWGPWRESFEAFFTYLGPKPTPEHTIERIDFRKGYEPGNVMWATRTQQNRNKSDNVKVTFDGATKTVAEWALESPVPVQTIYKRVLAGWLDRYGAERTLFYVRQTKTKVPKGAEE